MSSAFWNQAPRRPRYRASDKTKPHAEIARADGTVVQAELQDLSRMGFQLRLAVPLATEESVQLRLHVEQADFSLLLRGTVRWQNRLGDDAWLVGCGCQAPVDWESLGELFLNEVLSQDGP
jgi:hypothetical protein